MISVELIEHEKQIARRIFDAIPQRGDIVQIGRDAYIVRRIIWTDPNQGYENIMQVEHLTTMDTSPNGISNALKKADETEEQRT